MLELSGVDVGGEARQLEIGERLKLLSDSGEVAVYSLINDLFPEIPDGVKVRPALGSDDLRLIRDGLMELMRVRGENGSGSRCVQLVRRMLRRT
ncbi:hypothetical protein ACFLVH_00055 [Chloroflexota bacterium]